MGSYLKHYDKEYMKVAMLKQEETFKQQVHELHRLYRVQKLLMNDMKAELKRQRKSLNRWKTEHKSPHERPRQVLNLELPAEEYIGKDNGDAGQQVEEEENGLELTLATGTCRRRKNENSFTSDSATSFSSSSTESGHRSNSNDWGLIQVPQIQLGSYQNEMKSKFKVEAQMSQESGKRPPWLFPCLSLNMTS